MRHKVESLAVKTAQSLKIQHSFELVDLCLILKYNLIQIQPRGAHIYTDSVMDL